jgi:hypothetical protein
MRNSDKFVSQDATYQALLLEEQALEKRLEEVEEQLAQIKNNRIDLFCSQYGEKFGFRIDAEMRVICSLEMNKHADAYYWEKFSREDLANHHFPIGYRDMHVTDIRDDAIELQGYGSSHWFPPDMVKRATRYYKE